MQRVTIAVLMVAALALAGSSALAQTAVLGTTSRYYAMGGTGIASANDAGAVTFNPANLGFLGLQTKAEPRYGGRRAAPENLWTYEVAGSAELDGELDFWGLSMAAKDTQAPQGFGFSYGHMSTGSNDDQSNWLVGYGQQVEDQPWSWGVSIGRVNVTGFAWDDEEEVDEESWGNAASSNEVDSEESLEETVVNVGFLYNIEQMDKAPVKVGLTAVDAFNATDQGPFYGIGAAIPLDENTLLAVDYEDLTDEVMAMLNAGVEYQATQNLSVRAGVLNLGQNNEVDAMFTAGVGYKAETWKADFAWIDTPDDSDQDDEFVGTVSFGF